MGERYGERSRRCIAMGERDSLVFFLPESGPAFHRPQIFEVVRRKRKVSIIECPRPSDRASQIWGGANGIWGSRNKVHIMDKKDATSPRVPQRVAFPAQTASDDQKMMRPRRRHSLL